MKSSYKVSDIGEKALIERIIERSKDCSTINSIDFNEFSNTYNFSRFATSIGDDSALINQNLDNNSYLVASTDMLIQSSHFPKSMSYYQMGYKSVVVNVSDLASNGAENIGFLLNIAIPADLLIDDFDNLICGVVQACNDYDIPLIGGDTNQGDQIIISGTAIGQVDKNKALMKYGFKKGDLVCISGKLGFAALGFELIDLEYNNNRVYQEKIQKINKIDSSTVDLALYKALKPDAKYKEGHILREFNSEKNRISVTDITDGLASELYEILNADYKFSNYIKNSKNSSNEDRFSNSSEINKKVDISNSVSNEGNYYNSSKINKNISNYFKGIRIYENKLPIENEFKEISSILNLNYLDLVLHVGEDFEFLFVINPEIKEGLEKEMEFYVIGEITENNNLVYENKDNEKNNFTVEMVLSNGEIVNLSSKGYEHLS